MEKRLKNLCIGEGVILELRDGEYLIWKDVDKWNDEYMGLAPIDNIVDKNYALIATLEPNSFDATTYENVEDLLLQSDALYYDDYVANTLEAISETLYNGYLNIMATQVASKKYPVVTLHQCLKED